MSNPYAPSNIDPMLPPGHGVVSPIKTGPKVYTAGQVALAAFLGSIIGGAVLMAINDRRLGQPQKSIWTIFLGLAGTVGVLVIAFAVPEDFPASPITAGCVFLMYQLAKAGQGTLVATHLAEGGRQASSWAAAGIGLLCMVVLLIVVVAASIGLFILMPDLPMFAE